MIKANLSMKTHTHLEQSFNLPNRTLKALSFCRTDKHDLNNWIKSLPVADTSKSTRMLYVAIKEVTELDIAGAQRLELLLLLQPVIHQATQHLQKNYLNQSIILPEQPRKIALLCQALHELLSIGFIITALQCSEKMSNLLKKPTHLFAIAIHHALTEQINILTRNYLLYRPSNDGFWSNAHKLFQLAKQFSLQDIKISSTSSTIELVYLQLLLWGCIKANQLRQEDILKLQVPIQTWVTLIRLGAIDKSKEAAFIVDPSLDIPPMYQKFYRGKYPSACRCLDTETLTQELKQISSPLTLKQLGFSANLINHLILAWGVFTGRTFMRLESTSTLSLCIGIASPHYFLRNKTKYIDFIYGDTPRPKAKKVEVLASQSEFKPQLRSHQKLDVWDQSVFGNEVKSIAQVSTNTIDFNNNTDVQSLNDAEASTISEQEKHQSYLIPTINMSPGGYCLAWDEKIPQAIKAGEIIGIKEDHHVTWNIGTIRWVRQNKEQRLQVGVELLSPNAIPYGARVADFEGNPKSDFMRVLATPEIKAAGQSASLITPAVTFKTGQYVLLMSEGKEICVELKKLISSSGSYFQFTYNPVKTIAPLEPSGKMKEHDVQPADIEFDSVWGLLK